MRCATQRPRCRAGLLAALAALTLLFTGALPGAAETGAEYALADGRYFAQTGRAQGQGYAVRDAGADSNGKPIKFWTEFLRLGGVAALGYPIGQPYVASDGFTYQPFQRGVLQWRPERGQAVLSNIFEALQSAGSDNWLLEAKGVPKPIHDDASGGDFGKAIATRMAWLTNDAIKAQFLANPNPRATPAWNRDRAIERYGLPMSRPEKHGPFISQRFQRTSFQQWVEEVPGMPAKGSVVAVLGGNLMKEAGLLPASTLQAAGPTPASVPPGDPWPAPGSWSSSPFSGPLAGAPIANFGVVDRGILYRSAQPADVGYRWLLDNGFKSIVSFRRESGDDREYVLGLGFRSFLWLSIADETDPGQDDGERFLQFVADPRNWPILMHCKVGLGRTGTMAALVRYALDGWSMTEAIAEARFYRGGVDLIPSQLDWLNAWAATHPPAQQRSLDPTLSSFSSR